MARQLNLDIGLLRRQLIEGIIGSDRDPLVILIDIAADTAKPDDLRVQAAGIAVRFIHPTLQSVAMQVSQQKAAPDQEMLLTVLRDRLDRLAPTLNAKAIETTPEHAPGRPRDLSRGRDSAHNAEAAGGHAPARETVFRDGSAGP